MICNAKNGSVKIGDTSMDFVCGGSGEKKLIILPGLSEGLTTVKGKAIFLLYPYRKYFDRFTVYMFSRKKDMPKGYSIQEMAADQAAVMTALGIDKACVLGVSQGGMIAQCLAIDYPELVEKLVIAVSAPRVNEIVREYVSGKIETAQAGDHKTAVCCQINHIAFLSNDDITLWIMSPGGSVSAGLAILDTMNACGCEFRTIVMGTAASMAAVIASSGTKGKRFIGSNSGMMIHQALGGFSGQAADILRTVQHIEKVNNRLYGILAANTGLSVEKIATEIIT